MFALVFAFSVSLLLVCRPALASDASFPCKTYTYNCTGMQAFPVTHIRAHCHAVLYEQIAPCHGQIQLKALIA